jgi:hypothetical protein
VRDERLQHADLDGAEAPAAGEHEGDGAGVGHADAFLERDFDPDQGHDARATPWSFAGW